MARDVRIGFVSLGCAKNLVDSEKMLGQLAEGGCVVGADLPDADVIVVNTCGFLEASRTEAHAANAGPKHVARSPRRSACICSSS